MAQRMTTGEALRIAHDAEFYTDAQVSEALRTLHACRPSRGIKEARYVLAQVRAGRQGRD